MQICFILIMKQAILIKLIDLESVPVTNQF